MIFRKLFITVVAMFLVVSTAYSTETLKGKNISMSATVWDVFDNNEHFVWVYVDVDESIRFACPVRKDNYSSYVNIKAKDVVIIKGQIIEVGKFGNNKDINRLFLQEGCTVTRQ
jgi:hypothetical protein